MCETHDHKNSGIHKKVKRRYGSAVQHGIAHQREHAMNSRRDFLKSTGLFSLGSAMMLGNVPITSILPNKFMSGLANSSCENRTLLLLRLSGGNDGLNTIIPRSNSEYYNIRPNIAIPESGLWGLDDQYGMPNFMQDLQPSWEEGKMKVIHNVGYPEANYSHFRSSDIWASSSDSDEFVDTGWIGRLMEMNFPAYTEAPPAVPPALQIGVQTNMIFNAAVGSMALSISNPTEFYQIAQSGQLYNTNNLGSAEKKQELAYVRSIANSSFRYSESIREAYNRASNDVDYNPDGLANQLRIISRLIKGNLGTKVYMVTIGGYDTHANQADQHARLMDYVAKGVKSFYEDLRVSGQAEDVLTMTFSEFGRTIFENGSQGTDHGTGGPMMVFGEDIGNGFVGEGPDIVNVDEYGDPFHSVDFRSVYGSILRDWLCVDEDIVDDVIGSEQDKIDGLVPVGEPAVGLSDTASLQGYNPSPTSGMIQIKYSILQRGNVVIQIQKENGNTLRTVMTDFREKGSHTFELDPAKFYLGNGKYKMRLMTGGRAYSRPMEIGF